MSNVPFAAQMEELAAYMASKISVPTIGIGGGYAPIGTIISYMGTTAPQDYLACDGSTKNIADYPQLAEFFAAQFGSANFFGGNGTTTFAVPDLRGEFLRGTGNNSHTNQGNGANVGTHQDATTIPYFYAYSDGTIYQLGVRTDTNGVNPANTDSSPNTSNHYANINSTQVGEYSSHESYTARPTNTSILYCIKAVVAGEVYSTEERVVGTWIDGKPVYQKTFNLTVSSTNTTIAFMMATDYNIDFMVNAQGILLGNTTYILVPYITIQDDTWIRFIQGTSSRNIAYTKSSNTVFGGLTLIATIQYTKTT